MSTPIQPYPATTSTTRSGPRVLSGVPTLCFMAIMLAVPPIQLPDRAAKPFHATGSSKNCPNSANTTGPPTMMPSVPAHIMNKAMGLSRIIAFKSTVIMRRKSEKGSR